METSLPVGMVVGVRGSSAAHLGSDLLPERHHTHGIHGEIFRSHTTIEWEKYIDIACIRMIETDSQKPFESLSFRKTNIGEKIYDGRAGIISASTKSHNAVFNKWFQR